MAALFAVQKQKRDAEEAALKLQQEGATPMDTVLQLANQKDRPTVSIHEVVKIFKGYGMKVSSLERHQLKELADEQSEMPLEKFISYAKKSAFFREQLEESSYYNTHQKTASAEARAKAMRAFKLVDTDNNGYISIKEFKKITKSLPRKQSQLVFSKFDENDDNVLSFEEFKNFLYQK